LNSQVVVASGWEADEQPGRSFLGGVRVLELADELGEYSGKLLAGLGADVLKVEPPGGERTRTYGPFFEDVEDPNRSLHFWHYNHGKRGITLDLDSDEGVETLRNVVAQADVLIDTRHRDYLPSRGLAFEELQRLNKALIYCRISPYGDTGPWADYEASDLVQLALGGVVMNCGYDSEPEGGYDLPPIAPQMWQAYHISGDMAVVGVLGALLHRDETGEGQQVSVSVHEAVSKNTETDLPDWVYLRQPHTRRTCRHSLPGNVSSDPVLALTKDGRWLLPYRSYLRGFVDGWSGTVALLDKYGFASDLTSEQYQDADVRQSAAMGERMACLTDRLVGAFKFDRELWREAQALGLPWAPLRRPEENLTDDHWRMRETFVDVEHSELGRTFTYIGAKWYAPAVPWRRGPRAPLLGEHNDHVSAFAKPATDRRASLVKSTQAGSRVTSARGTPFALSGVRVVDCSWLLASAGAGRFLAALGAEVIKVEHETKWDAMRWNPVGAAPLGGRAERDAATSALETPPMLSPNRGGAFMEINSGKYGISLNLKEQRGKEILEKLIANADMIVEGFSPGTMERLGFGYEHLRQINPRIIYIQQSGMGQIGTYGSARSYGPTAQALSGISEMSGLPEPFAPAGIGYSFLDWFGAYNLTLAMLAALYRQRWTGQGCYIDSSQVEAGTYLGGTAILDCAANGRGWRRYGNRSPYRPAAPHGIFPTAGEDRWIAVACFSDAQWVSFATEIGRQDLLRDDRFQTLDSRLQHQDALEAEMANYTSKFDRYELMASLQAAGVPAGVCQTTEDRCETDPQLRHLEWLVELEQTEIGRWPVRELPFKLSKTPPYIGGVVNRSGPNYGEDNDEIYQRLLGFTGDQIAQLRHGGVV
jgi:crotonobetainyl-CoA:carnitine CoA-transferase CaiB-like acyl-CoA transferase